MMLTIRTGYALTLFAFLLLSGCKREAIRAPVAITYGENRCGGPPSWSKEGLETGELVSVNRIDATTSGLKWNGSPVDQATLGDLLRKVTKFELQPVTMLVVEGRAGCDGVNALRRLMETSLKCSTVKMCVEYSKSDWSRRHPPLPPPPTT